MTRFALTVAAAVCCCLALGAQGRQPAHQGRGQPLEAQDIWWTLMEFYNQTSGPTWVRSNGWGTHTDYCKWDGITCDSEGLLKLEMNAWGIKGTVPDVLADLGMNITGLQLGRNQLVGTLPLRWWEMSRLTELSVENNWVTGTIPDYYSRLTALQLLWVAGNKLTGTVPQSLQPILEHCAAHTDYQGCRLGGNPFTCPVPAWVPTQCYMGCGP
eukprot:TRINITY_DN11721_c0_g1_i1.p1 TRINITY_DN11721_c0_g1~~TRINITY_DN11721_c0_g1_i1.p1  ORF type:complete len:213 (-),score=36.20 TRINITY_DN11721_c0_g1_i1:384-1022(-)